MCLHLSAVLLSPFRSPSFATLVLDVPHALLLLQAVPGKKLVILHVICAVVYICVSAASFWWLGFTAWALPFFSSRWYHACLAGWVHLSAAVVVWGPSRSGWRTVRFDTHKLS